MADRRGDARTALRCGWGAFGAGDVGCCPPHQSPDVSVGNACPVTASVWATATRRACCHPKRTFDMIAQARTDRYVQRGALDAKG